MLSETIDELSDALMDYAETGLVMDGTAVKSICAFIRVMADDARRLEAVIAPARDLPEGVVPLLGRPPRRIIPITSGGGDAA